MIRTISQDYKLGNLAQSRLDNPFENTVKSTDIDEVWYDQYGIDERTQIVMSDVKTIVNKVDISDVGLQYSISHYQVCEHGVLSSYPCNAITCWGHGARLDSEQKIVVKRNAPELLEQKLSSRTWQPNPITLGGSADCYNPVERKLRITRKLLEVFLKYKHPVRIVTKSALILRDMDLLTELHQHGLVSVAISVSTLNSDLHQAMEPRTASPKKRMQVVQMLSQRNIPVTVLAAPIIPGLNDEGIFTLVKVAADYGATDINHVILRLNGEVAKVFKDWARKSFPYRWRKILRKVADVHKGRIGSNALGVSVRGGGQYAEMLTRQFSIAKRTYGMQASERAPLNTTLYDGTINPQMSLFD